MGSTVSTALTKDANNATARREKKASLVPMAGCIALSVESIIGVGGEGRQETYRSFVRENMERERDGGGDWGGGGAVLLSVKGLVASMVVGFECAVGD